MAEEDEGGKRQKWEWSKMNKTTKKDENERTE
jgi:hypothetical protein